MDKPVFKLEVFEGPLDLLLKLISKHKINIYDIPIALVLDQYMESIEGMKQIDLDVASEFMTMAAYLLYIKSQTLLPRHEEEQEDPRENLVRMLLEYQRYKAVAASLQALYTRDCCRVVRAQQQPKPDDVYRRRHSPYELASAYAGIFKRVKTKLPPPVSAFRGIVGTVVTTVSSRVANLLRRLFKRNTMPLAEAFETAKSRSDVVATFLAVLELTSSKRIRLEGEDDAVQITLRRNK